MSKSWQLMYEDAIRARRDDKARIAALEAALREIADFAEQFIGDDEDGDERMYKVHQIADSAIPFTPETQVKPSDPERIEIARCPRCGRLPRPTLMGRTICDNCGGFDVPQSLQAKTKGNQP
jgi:hypothetical protein